MMSTGVSESKIELAREFLRKAEMFRMRPENPTLAQMLLERLEDTITWETHPDKLLSVWHYILLVLRDASTQLSDSVLRPLGVEDLFALRDQFYATLGRVLPRLADPDERWVAGNLEEISRSYRDALFHVRAAREKRERLLARNTPLRTIEFE